MADRVHFHERLIFSAGTQVVALRDVMAEGSGEKTNLVLESRLVVANHRPTDAGSVVALAV
jgi:hypothetical protein